MHIVLPFVLFELWRWSIEQFASNQKVVHFNVWTTFLGTVYHACMVYYLCAVKKLGFTGICWATGTMFFVRFLVVLCFMKTYSKFTWFDDVSIFSRETFTNLRPLIFLSLKSCAMGVWGWWAFDIFTFMSTYLG